jgi:hypothetical protein
MKDTMPTIQKDITNYSSGEGRLHSENFTKLHFIFFFGAARYYLTLFSCFFKLSTVQLEQMDTAHNSVNNGK